MPALADLHRHLDGSLRPVTLEALAAREGLRVPARLAFERGMGLSAALERFAFTLSVLQSPEAVRRVAAEICEDAAADSVSTLEIRFAPQLHRGASPEAIVDAALEGIAGRAGLILCGLYGEPVELLEKLVGIGAARRGVVGIDLAGGPLPNHSVTLTDYRRAFLQARDAGLGRTVHAGEGRAAGEIRVAIEQLEAQRIGHGTTILDDDAVVELALERSVVLEACPTSNVHTGVIASVAEHPLPRWLARGLKVCLCTDNTLLSAVTASQELENVRAIQGVTPAFIEQVVAQGHRAKFVRG